MLMSGVCLKKIFKYSCKSKCLNKFKLKLFCWPIIFYFSIDRN